MAKTLSSRLTYRIMAVVLAMMVVITAVVRYFVREYMLDEAQERYLGILLENHQEMRRWLSEVHVAVENNVHDIERDIDDPDAMFGHMERIVRRNPSIVCAALLFEQDFYPVKGRVFVPCARRDAADSVRVSRIDSTYHGYFYDEWFVEQVQQDQSCWTKPYFESQMFAGNQEPRLLTTYATPIHDRKGRPVALLVADLSLEELRDHIMEDIQEINDLYEKGQQHHSFFFIVNREGTIIIHPDKQRMLTQCDSSLGRVMRANRGSCVTEIDGVVSRLFYRNIDENGWVMVIVTPKDVIQSNAHHLNLIILSVMFLGLLAIYLFCRRQIKEIADPISAQKAAFERELKIANGIQMAMLPQTLNPEPFARPNGTLDASSARPLVASTPRRTLNPKTYDLYASLTPARDVGGDLYDYFLRDDRLFFCIGDVSGKGVPAALMMAVMRAMFRSETRRTNSAAAIVDSMNRNLSEEYTAGYFITMFVGVLDLTTGGLDYCNAGHEAPVLSERGNERCVLLPIKPNLPVGALPDWNYEGQEAQLQPGDMLFLYTDGLSEAMNSAGEQLGRKHVLQLASEHLGNTARQFVEFMEGEVKRHAGDAPQNDDITLLAFRWQPSSTLSLRASMDDIVLLEPFVATVSQKAAIDDKEAKRLRLAVEEAVANVINYGEATNITLQATVEDGLLLTIDDDGKPFDPTAGSTTDFSVPPDERPIGGLGIMLLHEMTDGLEYRRIDGHNILTIKKNRNNVISK